MGLLKTILIFLGAALSQITAYAATTALNGSQLLNAPGVSFPTTTPILKGNSLFFGPGWFKPGSGGQNYDELFILPILPAGALSASSPSAVISIFMRLTRLQCIETYCLSPVAWDGTPHIALTDGSGHLGAIIADNRGGQSIGFELTETGSFSSIVLFRNADIPSVYPDFPGSLNIEMVFMLDESLTTVAVFFEAGFLDNVSGSFTSTTLDRTSELSLALLRDNNFDGQYKFDLVLITVQGVTDPVTITTDSILQKSPFKGEIGGEKRGREY